MNIESIKNILANNLISLDALRAQCLNSGDLAKYAELDAEFKETEITLQDIEKL